MDRHMKLLDHHQGSRTENKAALTLLTQVKDLNLIICEMLFSAMHRQCRLQDDHKHSVHCTIFH